MGIPYSLLTSITFWLKVIITVTVITQLVTQIAMFFALTLDMGFEWIISLFLSMGFMFFPILQIWFLYNKNMEQALMNRQNSWSIWFWMLFQLSALVVVRELVVGSFAEYFQVMPRELWSQIVVYSQVYGYGVEIFFFFCYIISLMTDYELIHIF